MSKSPIFSGPGSKLNFMEIKAATRASQIRHRIMARAKKKKKKKKIGKVHRIE
jgi:hypothetical protein